MKDGTSKADSCEKASAASQRVIHIILPAFNEASHIGPVLRGLAASAAEAGMSFRVIVVDDGSADTTGRVVRDYPGPLAVTLIEHASNLGLGAAIRSGLLRALEDAGDTDVIVTMDADETHTPMAIAQMIAAIDRGNDVLVASRYRAGAQVIGVPIHRRFLSYTAALLFRLVFPIEGVRDFTCGYRAYRASVLREAFDRYRQEFITEDGFQCMVDVLLKLRLMHLRFGEVPLLLRYDLKTGKSKMNVTRTVVNTLVLMARRRLGF